MSRMNTHWLHAILVSFVVGPALGETARSLENSLMWIDADEQDKDYYVAFDGDAWDWGEKLCKELLGSGRTIHHVLLPHYHDPASLGRERFERYRLASPEYGTTTYLRYRLGFAA